MASSRSVSVPAELLRTHTLLGICCLTMAVPALAQTPSEALDEKWREICAQVDPDSDLAIQCELIINAGPGSGDRINAASAGNNLGIISAQSRVSQASARNQLINIESRLDEKKDATEGGSASAEQNFGRLSLFVIGNYADTDRDDSDFETGWQRDFYGATFGADYRYSNQTVAGLALGYGNAETDFDNNAGKLDTDSISVTGYGNFRPNENVFIDAYLGYTWLDYDHKRNIDYDLVINAGDPDLEDTVPISTVAKGKTDGRQWFGGINLGHDRVSGQWTLSPQASIDFIETDIDSYSERGGDGLAQEYDHQSISSLTARLGGRASYAASRSWGVLLPQASLFYLHEFGDDARTLGSSFVQDPTGTKVNYKTEEPDRNYFTAGIGVTAVLANGVMPFVDYQTLFSHKFIDEQAITLGVRVEF